MERQGMPDLSGLTVLQVIPALDAGGAERTTIEVAQGLVGAGARCLVASEGGALTEQLEAAGGRHLRLPTASKNPMVMARLRALLLQVVREEGVGLVHARSRAPAWPALAAAREAALPFVTTYHGIYSGRTRLKRLYNSVMARGDVVIANSGFTAQVVRETYAGWRFFDPSRLVAIPRGADLSAYGPDAVGAARMAAVRAAFGGEGAFRVLLPGRLTGWKGQGVLIEAARLLQERASVPTLRVVLAGADQGREAYRAELSRMIEQAGLQAVVAMPGHWKDMPAAYAWSDVTVSASTRPEAFGRVAVEAMASGRPVVATAHGGSLETVIDGRTGVLTPPDDAPALADALERLACDPQRRARMGAVAARHAAERFSTAAMVGATLDVYASLTERDGPSEAS